MPSAQGQQHAFPAVPQSLSAGDHETRDYYAEQESSRPASNQTPYLTPYLGLRARLSQIWINRWTVLLLLVLVRTLLAIASIDDNMNSARTKALSACSSVESMGSTMASMPHYMSQGVNELAATGVEKAVNGLMSMLELSVTAVEQIVLFIINLLTSTYVCLITFAVGGSLKAAIELAQKVTTFLDENIGPIGDDIASGVEGFTNKINDFVDSFNSIPFVDTDVPKLDVNSDIDKLKNVELPSGINDDLEDLKGKIPDFKDVQNFTNGVISIPFELIKEQIRDMTGNYTFDRSVFPVPLKETLNFCTGSDGINAFFDNLVDLVKTARKVAIGVLTALALAVIIPMAWREIRRYRTMQRRARLFGQAAHDQMDVVYLTSRPTTAGTGLWLGNRFGSSRRQTLVRWAVAYATSTPALFVLSLAVAGLFACVCQLILLRAIQKEVPELTNQVGAFAEKVVGALSNASESWANGVNGAISQTNDEINQEVFGWVETATTSVNDTLTAFVDKMNEGLEAAFGGTPLEDPVKDVINCLIGLKIEGIQKGLTWVHDHAHVTFPGLPADTFSLGAAASIADDDSSVGDFLAAPGATTRDEITDAVGKVIDKFRDGIFEEACISLGLLAVWLVLALGGAARAFALFFGRDNNTYASRSARQQSYPLDPETAAAVAAASQHNLAAAEEARDYHAEEKKYRPESTAPPYEYAVNRAAPYTLQPRPFPTFEHTSRDERQGDVGARRDAGEVITHPTHARKSSYGQMAGPESARTVSPVSAYPDEKGGSGNHRNPFSLFRR